jgi:hypothetical protein
LNQDHESGKKEKVLLEDMARQQLLLKISNCLSMSVVASNTMLTQSAALVTQLMEALRDPNFDIRESNHLGLMKQSLLNAAHTFGEVQVNSNDMVKLVADSLLSDCHERRRLWTEASTLRKEQVVALNAEPVHTPVSPSEEGWSLLSPSACKKIHDWTEATNANINVQASQRVLGLQFQSNRPPTNRQPKGQNKKFQNSKGQGKGQKQPFRGGAESAGQGGSNSAPNNNNKTTQNKQPYKGRFNRRRQNNKK